MTDVRDAIAALHETANYGGNETARQSVTDYLDETDPNREQDAAPVAYRDQRKADLVDEAEARGIDSSGTKADIVARLEADDQGEPDPVLDGDLAETDEERAARESRDAHLFGPQTD